MSDILKITFIGLVGGILAMTVGQYRKEFGVLTGLSCAVIIFLYIAEMLGNIVSGMNGIIEETGVDIKYFTAVIKVVGIAYITQFGSEILRDCGENAIALKLELTGKIFIMGLTLPIISDFLRTCIDAVEML